MGMRTELIDVVRDARQEMVGTLPSTSARILRRIGKRRRVVAYMPISQRYKFFKRAF